MASNIFLNSLNLKALSKAEQVEQLHKDHTPPKEDSDYCLIHVLLSKFIFFAEPT